MKTIYTVRINYKSGKVEEFDCTRFKITNGSSAEWEACGDKNPIWLNVADIESVWQISSRKVADG